MPIGYSQEELEYKHKRPANVTEYGAVVFSHPAIDSIYLVAGQINSKTFLVDGSPVEFTPVSMQLPESQNQNSKINDAGSIQFSRIGMEFRQKMRLITRYTGIEKLTATVLVYSAENTAPIRSNELLVPKGGIAMNEESVTVKLTLDNPAMITKRERVYDPEIFIGLQ